MTHNLDSTQTALVTHDVHWIPVSQQEPPYGAKCFVIDKEQGIAYVRLYHPNDGWTHWHPMFTFAKDK